MIEQPAFEFTPEARKMLFEMAKHLTTLDSAGILLLVALVEKFPQKHLPSAEVRWIIMWLMISLFLSVALMYVIVSIEASRKHGVVNVLFVAVANIAAYGSFFVGFYNLAWMGWFALGE